MKDRVMKTRNGVELFFDGNTFYSSNPNDVWKKNPKVKMRQQKSYLPYHK